MAGANSSNSLEIRPAPRSIPIRVGSTPPSTRPASATPSCAAVTASWMSRARYFFVLCRAFQYLGRAEFFRSKLPDLGAHVVGKPVDSECFERTNHSPPFGQGRPNTVRTIAQGCHQSQTGYDHAAFVTKHESLIDLRRSWSRSSSSPQAITRSKLHYYYYFEVRSRGHKLDAARKFFADNQDIRSA